MTEKFTETVTKVVIVDVICASIVIDNPPAKPKAVCRFFLRDGTFIGEVPAKDIVAAANQNHNLSR